MTRLRVAFVDHTAVLGGGEHSLIEIVSHARDFEPVVILGDEGPLVDELAVRGIGAVVTPLDPTSGGLRQMSAARRLGEVALTVPRWGAALARSLAEHDVDLVVANSLRAGLASTLATRRLGLPLVWVVRDRITRDYLGATQHLVARTALRAFPDLIVANSNATASTCPDPSRVTVIPPSVRPLRVTTDRSGGATEFAMVARLAPWKGQDRTVRAFARAFPDGPERLRLVGGPLFGETDYEDDVRRLVDELGLSDRVTMTGHVADVAPALDGVDVVVHATRLPEPFGRSIVEAMSAGIPVVVEDVGGPADIVSDRDDGLVVPHGDESALVAAMIELAADPGLRARLGGNAVVTSRRYAPETLEAAWVDAFERATAPARDRPTRDRRAAAGADR